MLNDVIAFRNYFAKLGLEQEIADIYLSLYSNGPQNISALSRSSGIERTRIYRLIDKLLDSNLVELEMQNKRGLIKAAPISNLRLLINQRQEKLKNLTDELELLEQTMSRSSLSHANTRVQFFFGAAGIRQMLELEHATKTDVIGYLPFELEALVGKKFWGNYQTALKKRETKQIIVTAPAGATHACLVYDDVIAYIFAEGELYGLQIHDAGLATAQRQLIQSR